MTEQRIWITAYQGSNREILETRPPYTPAPLLFEFDERRIAHAVTQQALDSVRANGCRVRFYSIPDPF